MLTVYIPEEQADLSAVVPVLMCVDGQWLGEFARRIHEEIQTGRLAAIALVGLQKSEVTRNQDYVFGFDKARYEAREHFVLYDVIPFLTKSTRLNCVRCNQQSYRPLSLSV